jgi:hypothetical protein
MTDLAWIPVDPKRIAGLETSGHGVQTVTAPSPYDVPDAVSVETDTERNSITIRFRYLEPEKTDAWPIRKNLIFHVGHRTRRLYAIEATTSNVRKVEALKKVLVEAMNALVANVPALRRENFKAAKRAVESKSDELVRVAVG